ncbi:MAG: DUF1254 domain-containing protein [Pseudomonadota bacterium]
MRWVGPLAVFIITAVGAHWATLQYTPSVIMDRTLATLKNRGVSQHAFTTPQRISPSTQVVVRTSPDLFYSLCRYDLSQPGSALRVSMGEWPDYQSLSFFDDQTNNFATFRGTGKQRVVKLFPRDPLAEKVENGQTPPDSETWQSTPSERGVVLIRRLAPTQEAFDAAKVAAEADLCELVTR